MKEVTLTRYERADTMLKRAIGIMFRKRITRPMLFIFPTAGRISMHSFFCPRFDAVFLDERKKVIETYKNIGPGRMIAPSGDTQYLIELPPGETSRKGIRKGTVIKLGRC